MKTIYHLCTVVLVCFIFAKAGEVTNSAIGYSMTLPENWIQSETDNAMQHVFEDTSGTYQSMIAIVKYDFSEDTVFTYADEWTRANFISYAFSVDADPFSIMVFYDTVEARQNEVIRAADGFSQFFSIDTTLSDWAEYIRFTASGTNGYEIYAIGPMEDMELNIGFYLTIIEGITLTDVSKEDMVGIYGNVPNMQSRIIPSSAVTSRYNLLGKTVGSSRSASPGNKLMIFRTQTGTRRALMLR